MISIIFNKQTNTKITGKLYEHQDHFMMVTCGPDYSYYKVIDVFDPQSIVLEPFSLR